MQFNAKELNDYIYDAIPITKAMGLRILDVDLSGLILKGPISKNINHKSTVFGGSISSALISAAWAWLFWFSQEKGLSGEVVIQSSEVKYLQPVRGDFLVQFTPPPITLLTRFEKSVLRFGKARISLESRITEKSQDLAQFAGNYVLITKNFKG